MVRYWPDYDEVNVTMPNRNLCAVLEELRKMYETRNFSGMLGHIEEAQSMANRMESALHDANDLEYDRRALSELRKELKALQKEKYELEEKSKTES